MQFGSSFAGLSDPQTARRPQNCVANHSLAACLLSRVALQAEAWNKESSRSNPSTGRVHTCVVRKTVMDLSPYVLLAAATVGKSVRQVASVMNNAYACLIVEAVAHEFIFSSGLARSGRTARVRMYLAGSDLSQTHSGEQEGCGCTRSIEPEWHQRGVGAPVFRQH